MPYAIRLEGADAVFVCGENESVLKALERAAAPGAARVGGRRVPVGCRQGGCGVCRVRVLSGSYAMGAVSRAHVSEAEAAQGFALACRLFPAGDLVVAPARKSPVVTTINTEN